MYRGSKNERRGGGGGCWHEGGRGSPVAVGAEQIECDVLVTPERRHMEGTPPVPIRKSRVRTKSD